MSLIISLIISKILGNIISGYVRVSSREQINGTGIERQIKAIETFAEDIHKKVHPPLFNWWADLPYSGCNYSKRLEKRRV